MNWPTNDPKTVVEILALGGQAGNQAAYLIQVAAELKDDGYEPMELQAQSATKLIVPCLAKKDDEFWAIYTFKGEWNPDAINSFILWTNKARADADLQAVKILLISDQDPDYLKSIMNENNGVYFRTVKA